MYPTAIADFQQNNLEHRRYMMHGLKKTAGNQNTVGYCHIIAKRNVSWFIQA